MKEWLFVLYAFGALACGHTVWQKHGFKAGVQIGVLWPVISAVMVGEEFNRVIAEKEKK